MKDTIYNEPYNTARLAINGRLAAFKRATVVVVNM